MTIDIDLIDKAIKELANTNPGANVLRLTLAYLIPPETRILEIGAGSGSVFTRNLFTNYKTLDFYSTEEIKAHFINDYGISGIEGNTFPPVDYVCKDGILHAVTNGEKFELIFSSHAIEHQPCLLTHLQEIEKILTNDGVAAFIIPSRCSTFDALRNASSTGDVIAKYHSKNRQPDGANVFEFYARHITLNPGRKVLETDTVLYSHPIQEAYNKFIQSTEKKNEYIDIHNWTFTPDIFTLIAIELYILGLTNLLPNLTTPINGNEFMCILSLDPHARTEEKLIQLSQFRIALNKKISLRLTNT